MLCLFSELKYNTKMPKNKNNHRNRHSLSRIWVTKAGSELKAKSRIKIVSCDKITDTRYKDVGLLRSYYLMIKNSCFHDIIKILIVRGTSKDGLPNSLQI